MGPEKIGGLLLAFTHQCETSMPVILSAAKNLTPAQESSIRKRFFAALGMTGEMSVSGAR
jgi:hypothetical protein